MSHERIRDKIYTDFAKRLGAIVKQYDAIKADGEAVTVDAKAFIKAAGEDSIEAKKYETTLYVCVLQNLIVQVHTIGEESQDESDESYATQGLPHWGVEPRFVNYPVKIGCVVENLRQILSHPSQTSNNISFESISENGNIVSYNFKRIINKAPTNRTKKLWQNCCEIPKDEEFQMEIPIDNLRTLIIGLCQYLDENHKMQST